MKLHQLLLSFMILSLSTVAMARTSVLFIGNSFTYGWGSPVRHYRASTVTDLNNEGIGGVPALLNPSPIRLVWITTSIWRPRVAQA